MKNTLLGTMAHKDPPKKNRGVCTACGEKLPRGTIFCPHCGPPEEPELEAPEEVGMTLGQAMLRIGLMILLFSMIAAYKLDVDFSGWFKTLPGKSEPQVSLETPNDEDFELFHIIDSPRANIREKPSLKSKILMVLDRGTEIEVIEEGEKWSKIKVKDGREGWVSSKLLSAVIR